MSIANYNGRQPNNTAYIKTFTYEGINSLWKIISYPINNVLMKVITPTNDTAPNLYIQGDLFLDGTIIQPSDSKLKKNVMLLNPNVSDKLMNIKPSAFCFKDDVLQQTHYGFIADEFVKEYPELVYTKQDTSMNNNDIKLINYLEMIPLLVHKIQQMQKTIDELNQSR